MQKMKISSGSMQKAMHHRAHSLRLNLPPGLNSQHLEAPPSKPCPPRLQRQLLPRPNFAPTVARKYRWKPNFALIAEIRYRKEPTWQITANTRRLAGFLLITKRSHEYGAAQTRKKGRLYYIFITNHLTWSLLQVINYCLEVNE